VKKVIVILFVGVLLIASEYRIVTGRVIDKETKQPLIGADVFVMGTQLGAAADTIGQYIIANLPVGTYTIGASCVAYDEVYHSDIRIKAADTFFLDFSLNYTQVHFHGDDFGLAETTPPVLSETLGNKTITSREIKLLPAATLKEVIKLQPGIVESEFGFHLRGSIENTIMYRVNGIDMHPSIPLVAIDELQITSNGIDVEYDDGLGSTIGIITKHEDQKNTGGFYFSTDRFMSDGQLTHDYQQYDLMLGGPIPTLKRLNYFIAGNLTSDDAHQEALYPIASAYNEYAMLAKLSFLFPRNKGSLSVLVGDNREQHVLWSPFTEPGNPYKHFENKPMLRNKQRFGIVRLDFMPFLKTLGSLKLSIVRSSQIYGTRDYEWEAENGLQWYNDYRLKAEHLIESLRDKDLPVRDLIIDSLVQYHNEPIDRGSLVLRNMPYGVEGLFYILGDYPYWSTRFLDQLQIKTCIIQWFGSANQLKAGVDYTTYDLEYYANERPYLNSGFWDYYERTPHKFAVYVQNKFMTKRITASLGFRYDYFQPNAFTYIDPWDFQNDSIITADPITNVSPRVGFRFLIFNNLAVHCKFTRRYQIADFHTYYTATDTAVIRNRLAAGAALIGNIALEPQNTTSFDAGIDGQVFKNIYYGASFYTQKTKGRLQIEMVPALPMPYYQYFTAGKNNVSGLEFYLKRRIARVWEVGLSYVLQSARNIAPDTSFWEDYHEAHFVQCYTHVDLPLNAHNILVRGISSSIYIARHSGFPYTPMDLRGNIIGDNDTLRMPGYWNIDWKLNKPFNIGATRIVLTCLILNLFNSKQVADVYNTTGEPDEHGFPDPLVSQFIWIPMISSRYSPQADHNHDGFVTPTEGLDDYIAARDDLYDDPTNYKYPFRIRIGIGIEF
jgi:hypothetical protein